jgi:hypothetical protein
MDRAMRGNHAGVGLAILMLPVVAAPDGCASSSGGYGSPGPAVSESAGSPEDRTTSSHASAAALAGIT